jgi:hypothetical protein
MSRQRISGSLTLVDGEQMKVAVVEISAAAVKTLNATPVTLVQAPGAGYALIFEGAMAFLDYASAAYDGVAAGEDLSVKYTGAAGLEVGALECTGFIDQASDQIRFIPSKAVAGFTPVANAPLVLNMLVGEIATGDSPLKLRVYYRQVPATW